MNEWEIVEELMDFMGYCCAEGENKGSTVAGKPVPVNVYDEQWVGLSLPLMKALKKWIRRAHVVAGYQTRARKPLTWEMIKVMEESIGELGVGGRIALIG